MFDANIKIVTIDNNHITNFGLEGLQQTIEKIHKNNLDYFGDPNNREILFKNINSVDLAFVSYNQFIRPDEEKALQLIHTAEMMADHTIVFAHWGDEYEKIANSNQTELARKFVDAGADLVIGAHSHVIGNSEVYKNKYIYYSLGNFIFDQYFSKVVSCGLVATFNFTEKSIEIISEQTVKMDPYSVVKFEECRL
jgi:poly-gamma-glutamate synthesis protein (capsule biosynthesis protein)